MIDSRRWTRASFGGVQGAAEGAFRRTAAAPGRMASGTDERVREGGSIVRASGRDVRVAARPVRYLAFDQTRLRHALEADSELKQAMDASFSRNLVGKLSKSGPGVTAEA